MISKRQLKLRIKDSIMAIPSGKEKTNYSQMNN